MPRAMTAVFMRATQVLALLGLVAVVGCTPKPPSKLGAPIEGRNHTGAAINWFMVNRNGGSKFGPYLGGRSQTCCVLLPVKWHPGLKVLVEWEKDPDPSSYGSWPERIFSDAWSQRMAEHKTHYTRHSAWVEVAPYDKLGVVNVHFLPCDKVAVGASIYRPGMKGYPFDFPPRMQEPAVCPAP